MKKLFAALLAVMMLLSVLAGCGDKNKLPSVEDLEAVAVEDAGLTDADVYDVHTHMITYEEKPAYNIHITTPDAEYQYYFDARGEMLASSK